MFLKIAEKYDLVCLPEPSIAYRRHSVSLSHELERSYRRQAEYFWILHEYRNFPEAVEQRERLVIDAYRSGFFPNWPVQSLLESIQEDLPLLIEQHDRDLEKIRQTYSYRLGYQLLQPYRWLKKTCQFLLVRLGIKH